MTTALVNTPFRSTIFLADVDSVPITGASFTEVENVDPNSNPFSYTVVEKSEPGVYEVRFTPTLVGVYTLLLSSDTSPVQWWITEVEATGSVPGFVSTVVTNGTDFITLIEQVATLLGDITTLSATIDGAPDGSTWVDYFQLAAVSNKAYKGSELVCTQAAGDNLYASARVLESSPTDPPTATLTPRLPEQVKAGDQAILLNLNSMGWHFDEYKRFINMALSHAYPNHLAGLTYTFADAFDRATPTLVVPDDFTVIARVEWQDTQGLWQEIPRAASNAPGWNGWGWDFFAQRLVIGGEQRNWASGYPLRIGGYGKQAPLSAMTDQTDCDPEWLVVTAASYALRNKRDPKLLAVASMDTNQANFDRPKMVTQVEADAIAIR